MTAQRIEAAKPTKPKGSAEGESLVGRADAPNSLSQKDSRMTDTTEQQAVTVAQEDREAVRQKVILLCDHVERFAYTRERTGDMDASPHFLAHAVRQLLAASPEPVPATNQAGEVERLREALRSAGVDFVHTPRSNHDGAIDRHVEESRKGIAAALATQPATSQEGNYPEIPGSSIAATPTPPTLSEDLREVVEQEAVDIITDLIGPGAAQSGTNCRVVEDHLKQFARNIARAQVKAS